MPIYPNKVHIDTSLTRLSVMYRNPDMIWSLVLPELKVDSRSDKYFVYDKADVFKLADDQIGPGGQVNEVSWTGTWDNYSVEDHALSDTVFQETIDSADNPIQPEVDSNDFINKWLDTTQEKRVVDLVFSAGSYPVGNKVQLAGDSQWGGANANPVKDVQDAVETPIMRPNTLVFGADAWAVYRALPEVLDAVKGATRQQNSPAGLATTSEIAALFEVERVLIGRSRYNSAKPGQALSLTRLWGKHMAALYVNPNPGIKTLTFGVTFVETRRQTTRSFNPDLGAKGAHKIKVAWNSDEKIIASDCGYFIQNACA